MTPHELLTLSATMLLSSSRNASYSPQMAVRDAQAIQSALEGADWLRPLERSLGLGASGCDESGGA